MNPVIRSAGLSYLNCKTRAVHCGADPIPKVYRAVTSTAAATVRPLECFHRTRSREPGVQWSGEGESGAETPRPPRTAATFEGNAQFNKTTLPIHQGCTALRRCHTWWANRGVQERGEFTHWISRHQISDSGHVLLPGDWGEVLCKLLFF